jgi:hypothetical protein
MQNSIHRRGRQGRRGTQILSLCVLCALCGLTSSAFAQDAGDERFPLPYVPPEQVQLGGYVATGAVELGWRFTALDGSREAYRSIVDLPRGPYLAFSRLELRSPENTGPIFDSLLVEGQGGPGEPSAHVRARASKRGIYLVDYRRSRAETYNFIPDFANPLFENGSLAAPHGWDRARTMDSLEVTIFPEKRIEGRFSYFRTRQEGLGLGTDVSNEALVFDRALDNEAHEVRAGVSFRWPKWLFSFEQGVRLYEDDERDAADPATVTDPDTLANFFRTRTTEATAPTSRATFTARPHSRLSLTARAVYVDYDVAGALAERVDSIGSDPAESFVRGRDEGHAFLFDATQDVRVLDRLRVSNYLRYRRYRSSGSTLGTFTNAGDLANAVRENNDRSIRDARIEDEAIAHVDLARGLLVRAGYRFARRTFDFDRTDTVLLPDSFGQPPIVRDLPRSDEQRYDAFIAGGSYRVRHDARLFVEYENGREPTINYTYDARDSFRARPGDYRLVRARGSWTPVEWLEFTASARATDRTFPSSVIAGRDVVVDDPLNPVFVRLFDGEPPVQYSRSRAVGATVRLTPWPWMRVGATFDRLDNRASVDYLTIRRGREVFRSARYVDEEALATADVTLEPTDRLTISGFYSLVNASGSLPVHYHQAEARGAYRIARGVSGVVSWRLYDYDDHRYEVTDFRANHASIGVRWEW